MADIWFVRAGKESVYAEDFIQRNIVAIGWPELGVIEPNITKPKLIQSYKQTFEGHSDGQTQVAVSQIIRFMHEVKVGDAVMTHDRDKQLYYLGRITSDCNWRPELEPELRRARDVEWQMQVPRSLLSSFETRRTGTL